jgi:7-carboxy-7-deazaguanine synthase
MQQQFAHPKGAMLRICEIYQSVQGEGLLTGTVSIFVRTSGCNLRCWFCDTPFASWQPEGQYLTVEQVLDQVTKHSARYVVLTGGEPMIFSGVAYLATELRAAGYHLTIETAGTVWHDIQADLWSISPKLSSSAPPASSGSWHTAHHRRRHRPDIVLRLMQQNYQLKFVVDSPADAQEVLNYLGDLGGYDGQRVLLMPQGVDASTLQRHEQWLIPWCRQHGLRYCPRAHIQWFGNQRGT